MGTSQLVRCMVAQKKIISSWARTNIFRYLHGDLTTNEKLFKAGVAESPLCEHCGEYDNYEHRYNACRNNSSLNTLLTEVTEGRGCNLNETLGDPLLKPKQLMIISHLITKIADFKSGKLLPSQHYKALNDYYNKL